MPRVLVVGRIHPAGLAALDAAGLDWEMRDDVAPADFPALIAPAEALILRTQPLTAATIAAAPRLGIVSRHGVGYDAVDLPALSARRIPLAIVGDVNSVSVAEHVMALMLAAAKALLPADRLVREGRWAARAALAPVELEGRRLLVVGYGRIGRRVARMASGFGMQVAAHDPALAGAWPEGPAAPAPDLAAALAAADVVTLHVPRTGDRPLLGAAEIAAMKPGAILINAARGGVVDEGALAAALAEGRLAAAGLDVFADEPPAPGHPLLACATAVLSPHVAAMSAEAAERMARVAAGNVAAFFAGQLDPALVVNPEVLA